MGPGMWLCGLCGTLLVRVRVRCRHRMNPAPNYHRTPVRAGCWVAGRVRTSSTGQGAAPSSHQSTHTPPCLLMAYGVRTMRLSSTILSKQQNEFDFTRAVLSAHDASRCGRAVPHRYCTPVRRQYKPVSARGIAPGAVAASHRHRTRSTKRPPLAASTP